MFSGTLHPPTREVAFCDDPYRISSRETQDCGPPRRTVERHEVERRDEDDSLEVVPSSNTGDGRAHTPQRLNRTNTPQRTRSSSFGFTGLAPVQISTACRSEGDSRRQPPGRRKQRRHDNDNLVGVERILRGRHAQEEGETEHLTLRVSRRSSLADLMSDENQSEGVAALRESIRKGLQPRTVSRKRSVLQPRTRRFAGGKWEDAEKRFLLVERRLRDVVVKALRNPSVLNFVLAMENLLDTFAKRQQVAVTMALPTALLGRHAAEVLQEDGRTPTLCVSLGPSPFHRLLLHALCQYRRLRSRSEQTDDGRRVCVTVPPGQEGSAAIPSTSLANFVVQTRLQDPSVETKDPYRPAKGVSHADGVSQEMPVAPAPSFNIGVEVI